MIFRKLPFFFCKSDGLKTPNLLKVNFQKVCFVLYRRNVEAQYTILNHRFLFSANRNASEGELWEFWEFFATPGEKNANFSILYTKTAQNSPNSHNSPRFSYGRLRFKPHVSGALEEFGGGAKSYSVIAIWGSFFSRKGGKSAIDGKPSTGSFGCAALLRMKKECAKNSPNSLSVYFRGFSFV